jgi:hypothetical protein
MNDVLFQTKLINIVIFIIMQININKKERNMKRKITKIRAIDKLLQKL